MRTRKLTYLALVVFIVLVFDPTVLFAHPDFEEGWGQLHRVATLDRTFSTLNQSEGEIYPAEVLQVLAKHDYWQTTSWLSLSGFSGGLTGYAQVWKYENFPSPHLKEITQLTVEKNCVTGKAIKWKAGRAELKRVDPSIFHVQFADFCKAPTPETYLFRILSGDRIEVKPKSENGVGVVFFPAIKATSKSPYKPVIANLYTAPIGPNGGKVLENSIGLAIPNTNYLHHDLNGRIQVVMDTSFPKEHRATLESSIRSWNRSLPTNVFEIQAGESKLDETDCISSHKLCIFWSGPSEVGWLGMGGFAFPNFDPLSGEIIGGWINFSNSRQDQIVPTPDSPELRNYLVGNIDFGLVASMYSARSRYVGYQHPRPEWELGQLFSHELGHFNGLSHNFAASNVATVSQPTMSLMDYPTFPASYQGNAELQPFDKDMIQLLYAGVTPKNYYYCGDSDSGNDGPSSDPNCNKWDYGAPDLWFIQLSKLGDKGVFSQHPKFEKPLLSFLAGFLEVSKSTVTTEQRKNVTTFLCSQSSDLAAIKEILQKNYQIELACK